MECTTKSTYYTTYLNNAFRNNIQTELVEIIKTIIDALQKAIVDRKEYLEEMLETIQCFTNTMLETAGMKTEMFHYNGADTAIVT